MLGYLSVDIICCEKRTVFEERSSRKTVSFEEQIMSKDKYPSIFSRQMKAIVYLSMSKSSLLKLPTLLEMDPLKDMKTPDSL